MQLLYMNLFTEKSMCVSACTHITQTHTHTHTRVKLVDFCILYRSCANSSPTEYQQLITPAPVAAARVVGAWRRNQTLDFYWSPAPGSWQRRGNKTFYTVMQSKSSYKCMCHARMCITSEIYTQTTYTRTCR